MKMQTSSFIPLLVALGLAALVATQPSPADIAAQASQLGIPQQCSDAASNLQVACGPEITKAQQYFGVENVTTADQAQTIKISDAQIQAYLPQAPIPSKACCLAACQYNNEFCSCNQNVLSVVTQFTGNDPAIYATVAGGFATACHFQPFLNSTNTTCPTDQAAVVKSAC